MHLLHVAQVERARPVLVSNRSGREGERRHLPDTVMPFFGGGSSAAPAANSAQLEAATAEVRPYIQTFLYPSSI